MRVASRVGRLAAPTTPAPVALVAPASLVDALGRVTASIRAGASATEAWAGVGARAPDGVPHADDLAGLPGADGAHVRAVQAACRLSSVTGAGSAVVLDRVLSSVAADVAAAQARRTALAGPTATSRLLTWLPALGLVMGPALGADPVAVLLDGGAGTVALVVGCVLALVGRRWGARLVARAEAAGAEP